MSSLMKRQLEVEMSLPAHQVDVMHSLQLFDQLVGSASDPEAMVLGEEFLPQIADAYAEKAAYLLERSLEADPQQDDPPFNIEWLYPFMRRYQNLDIAHLVGRAPNDYPEDRQFVAVSELSMEEAEQYIREPATIAHSEDISVWAERICCVLKESMSFVELQERTQLEEAELILGMLLGDFAVEQSGKFYEKASITISLP